MLVDWVQHSWAQFKWPVKGGIPGFPETHWTGQELEGREGGRKGAFPERTFLSLIPPYTPLVEERKERESKKLRETRWKIR